MSQRACGYESNKRKLDACIDEGLCQGHEEKKYRGKSQRAQELSQEATAPADSLKPTVSNEPIKIPELAGSQNPMEPAARPEKLEILTTTELMVNAASHETEPEKCAGPIMKIKDLQRTDQAQPLSKEPPRCEEPKVTEGPAENKNPPKSPATRREPTEGSSWPMLEDAERIPATSGEHATHTEIPAPLLLPTTLRSMLHEESLVAFAPGLYLGNLEAGLKINDIRKHISIRYVVNCSNLPNLSLENCSYLKIEPESSKLKKHFRTIANLIGNAMAKGSSVLIHGDSELISDSHDVLTLAIAYHMSSNGWSAGCLLAAIGDARNIRGAVGVTEDYIDQLLDFEEELERCKRKSDFLLSEIVKTESLCRKIY